MINNNHNFDYFFYHSYHHYSWGAQQAPWLLHLPLQDLKDWQVALGNDGNLDVCVWFSFSPFGWLKCGNVFPSWWCSQCVTLSDGNVWFLFPLLLRLRCVPPTWIASTFVLPMYSCLFSIFWICTKFYNSCEVSDLALFTSNIVQDLKVQKHCLYFKIQ